MLKKSLNDLYINPFNEFNYTWPILISGDVNNGFNGMTVSWGGLGTLWGKSVAFVFVRKSRFTYEFIEKSDSVTLSFLSNDYANAKKIFGSKSGRDIDKIAETGFTPIAIDESIGFKEAKITIYMKKKCLLISITEVFIRTLNAEYCSSDVGPSNL